MSNPDFCFDFAIPMANSLHELLHGAALEEREALQVSGGLEQLGLVRVLVEYAQGEQLDHCKRIYNNRIATQLTR